jgi:TRAP-type uncharacterized transport system substrate-binding protein
MERRAPDRNGGRRLAARLAEVSWRDLAVTALPALLAVAAGIWLAARFVRPAPSTIRLIGGLEGSSYRTNAERYKKIIEAHGVKVEIIPSRGSLDNLLLLANPKVAADVAFVQGGLTDGVDISHLVSLGSVFAQPLMVYYRATEPVEILTQLKGKRLAIGPEGSGTRALALKLLKANEMDGAPTALADLGGEEAARALIDGRIDAAFLMGDSATPQAMRSLRGAPGVRLMSFRQADGYLRRLHFLSKLTLPEGAMDLAKDYPPETVQLVGPTVELVAHKDLHPALSDLLISAAREVHSGPGMYRTAGEFPAPVQRDFPISDDAERYYKSGQQFLYKRLPFQLASLIDRLLVLVLPLFVLIVPASRLVPTIYRWRVRSRIYRFYGSLMAIERELMAHPTAERRAEIAQRLDEVEQAVEGIKTPLSFADQLYVLRSHVAMVRQRLIATGR